MRNFLKFLVRFHAFFLFLALEALCLVFYFRSAAYPNAAVVHSANRLSGSTYARIAAFRAYGRLSLENDSLNQQNARLRELLGQQGSAENLGTNIITDSLYRQQYTYVPVRIINSSITARNNYLTLDKGRADGLSADMGLVTERGIAGRIIAVSEHYAVAMSVLHSKFSTSAEWRPGSEQPGSDAPGGSFSVEGGSAALPPVSESPEGSAVSGRLSWNGKHPGIVQLIDLPGHVQPQPGDPIFTTGFSTLFPQGVPVGNVREVRQAPGSYFLEVDVALSADLASLRHAYAVVDLHKWERDSLEQASSTYGR
jgi:rod shape-determining protein MreC